MFIISCNVHSISLARNNRWHHPPQPLEFCRQLLTPISSMSECAPALSPAKSSRRLEPLDLTSRDTRTLLRDPDFQAIPDRNSQMAFLADFIPEQCYDTVNDTRLSAIYEISVGNVRKIRCSQRKRNQSDRVRLVILPFWWRAKHPNRSELVGPRCSQCISPHKEASGTNSTCSRKGIDFRMVASLSQSTSKCSHHDDRSSQGPIRDWSE